MPPTPEAFNQLNIFDVLDGLADGVTLADAKGRIVYSNAAADRMLGTSAAVDAEPDEWAEHYGVFLPDGSAPFPTDQYPLVRAVAGQATREVEMLVRNPGSPDGVLISASGRPLRDESQTIIGATVVFRDITELRRAQRMKEDLAAFIVHDLKSPLSAITATASLVAETERHQQDEELIGDARSIYEAARRVNRMVLDLLDSQMADDGALEPAVVDIDLAKLLSHVREAALARLASRDGSRVRVNTTDDPRVRADPELLFRVLMNLVDNCVKYGPRDGRIWIDVQPARVGDVLFTVRDEGPGVPERLRERIFDKYARVERADGLRSRDSRGLGLRFCKVVADAHGGRIWVEDAEPTGARFCLELPGAPKA